jgi:glycosyltransferase involved in cell wall biosynthesis
MFNVKKLRVCIITYSPLGKAGVTPISNLIKTFTAIGAEIYLISGGDLIDNIVSEKNIHVSNVVPKSGSNSVTKVFSHLYMQLKVLYYVVNASFKCNIFIVFLGEVLITPLLALKIMRKKLTLMLGITPSEEHFVNESLFSKLWLLFSSINARYADRLIIYSNKIIQDAYLTRYKHKTILAHEHSVNFSQFQMTKNIRERNCIVGYIGRLSEVKGVLNFVKAAALLSNAKSDATFLIGGTGELYSEIESFIRANKVEMKIKLAGWISHNDLPQTLNKLKLLVLPSYSEALPNILLEAMACGTPVLATPVGGIPDIINNGETGFLLDSNDPSHLANEIVNLLDKPELLEKVAENAFKYVRENFSEAKTLETWVRILPELQ